MQLTEIANALSKLVEQQICPIGGTPNEYADPQYVAECILQPFKEAAPNLCWTAHSTPPYIRVDW